MTNYIVEKVEDENLLEIADFILRDTDAILAGGVFRSVFSFDEDSNLVVKSLSDLRDAKDLDIFFRDSGDIFKYLALMNTYNMSIVWKTPNSTLINVELPKYLKIPRSLLNHSYSVNTVKLDIVNKYFGSPEEILDGFDFTISQCALYRENDEMFLMYHKEFFNHLKNNVLAYADSPEKSGNIIERLLRYVNYGFVPDENTVKQCLITFCQEFENIKDINIDELLKHPDFQAYHQKNMEDAKRFLVKQGNYRSQHRGQQHAILKQELRLQNKWMSMVYFLLDYWHSTVKINEYIIASFSNKYAGSYNLSKLLEQMSKDYSYDMINERCSALAGELGIVLVLDEYDELRWVYSSYSLMNMLHFFNVHQEALGLKEVQVFLKSLFSYRFVPQSKMNYIQCIDCGSYIHDRTCYCEHSDRLLELEADVILRALQRKSDEKWMKDCLSFFTQIHDSRLEQVPTLIEWHYALDNDLFDPEIDPSLMFPLMIGCSTEGVNV